MSSTASPRLDWKVVVNRATPPDHHGWGRVRASQILELRRALKVAAWAQTLNALLLVVILHDAVPPMLLTAWLLGLGLLILLGIKSVRSPVLESPAASRRMLDRASYASVLLYGGIWAIPPCVFFPLVGPPEQLAICLVTAGMMAGAAFIFTPTPAAAAGYVAVMGAATTKMLAYDSSPLIALLGPIYTAGLLSMVLLNGRAFMQRRCVELALEERSETISMLLKEYESSDADWLWETGSDLQFQNVSARLARALGRTADEVQRMSIRDLLDTAEPWDPASGRLIQAAATELADHAPFTDLLVPISGPDGQRCIQLSARPRFNRNGRFVGYRGVGSDVTETQQAARRIAHMARHDSLTGLPNRVQLLEALGLALGQARESDAQCAILLLDLDRFKSVNDTLGHVAGDHLLQQVSARIDPVLAPEMTVGRLGGDEFAIVVPTVLDAAAIERLCIEIIEAMKLAFVYNDQHLFVGASIGIALGPRDGDSVEELIRSADLALYRAKTDGGNDVRFYERVLHEQAEERRNIELAMRAALDNGEFNLVYQPMVDAATSTVRGFEALMRWRSPTLGDVPPTKFIPLAEETGLVGRIGEWALRNACAEAASWPDEISVAVNISPIQLHEPGFLLTLISALSQSGLDPRRLELEITETVFLQLTSLTQKVLHQIQSLGVRLAIDDFGTGYSSLGYLRDSQFDIIKIDRSFVSAISRDDPESVAIIKAVVALAGNLGMATVAEGVETEEQLEVVRALGCDHVQGYIISHPCPAPEARKLITGRSRRIAA